MSILEVSHVSKQFKNKAVLRDVNLVFEENKIYGLLGRNGSGRSTLFNIMTARINADSGEVLLDSENVRNNDRKLGMIYLMSETNLYSSSAKLQTIIDNTDLMYGSFDYRLAERLAKQFDLSLNQRFGKLSTGYRTIFKFIIALCVPVKFVILDEPVLGLDANHRDLLYQELLQSYMDNPRTFIIATHLIEEVAHIISDVIIIADETIVLNKPIEAITDKTHVVSGNKREVDNYTTGLNVIGTEEIGGYKAAYVFGNLNDNLSSHEVKIENYDLQKLFIFLTKINLEMGDGNEN